LVFFINGTNVNNESRELMEIQLRGTKRKVTLRVILSQREGRARD